MGQHPPARAPPTRTGEGRLLGRHSGSCHARVACLRPDPDWHGRGGGRRSGGGERRLCEQHTDPCRCCLEQNGQARPSWRPARHRRVGRTAQLGRPSRDVTCSEPAAGKTWIYDGGCRARRGHTHLGHAPRKSQNSLYRAETGLTPGCAAASPVWLPSSQPIHAEAPPGPQKRKPPNHLDSAAFSLSECPGLDLNQHAIARTTPSRWRVYQFHHPGRAGGRSRDVRKNRARPRGGDSGWARTNDPLVKSQLLCQLSYGAAAVRRAQKVSRPRRAV